MNTTTTLTWLLAILTALTACQRPTPQPTAPFEGQPEPDTGPTAPDAEALQDPPETVLLVDFEMRPATTWAIVLDGLAAQGYEPVYRRWYPHITEADTALDSTTGAPPWRLILAAAGASPQTPTARMRVGEVDLLANYLEAGGSVVLMPQNTWRDAFTADSDWFTFNRLLERFELPLRITRTTLIGNVSQGFGGILPRHSEGPIGYPGSLEWTLSLPVGYPTQMDLSPFAIGYAPALACDGDEIATLAQTHEGAIVWHTLEAGPDQIAFPQSPQPIAASALAGAGAVVVVPRGAMQLAVHTERASDKPVTNLSLLDHTAAFARAALAHAAALARDPASHQPTGCQNLPAPGLFNTRAEGFPALAEGPSLPALYPPDGRALPLAPPMAPEDAPPLTQSPPDAPEALGAHPTWFQSGRGRLGYGEPADYDTALARFNNARDHGMEAFVATVQPAWLIDYDPDADPAPFADTARAAADAGVALYLGVIAQSLYQGPLREAIGPTTGAYGQQLGAPPPTSDQWWDEALRPLFLGAARAALDHPGIHGLQLDLELYGAGALTYHPGFAFGPEIWPTVLAAIDATDARIEPPDRLAWLTDRGQVAQAFSALEANIKARAVSVRDEARVIHPELEFMIYSVSLDTGWYTRGLVQGLGVPDRPLVWLTYDIATDRMRQTLTHEGAHVRILGGVLGIRFDPQHFEAALLGAAERADGYWLFTLDDFPISSEDEGASRLHGPAEAYWDAVRAVSESLAMDPR